MFGALRSRVQAIETRLVAFISAGKSRVRRVRADVDHLDRVATEPLDRVSAKAKATEANVKATLAGLRRDVERLAPPP